MAMTEGYHVALDNGEAHIVIARFYTDTRLVSN
jgi:hypothetical protein